MTSAAFTPVICVSSSSFDLETAPMRIRVEAHGNWRCCSAHSAQGGTVQRRHPVWSSVDRVNPEIQLTLFVHSD